MARTPRVVAIDTPHHITQRGNNQQCILECDTDRRVYLELLDHHCRHEKLSLLGYCLMTNHVHLVAVPETPSALSRALKNAHGRYAAYLNARRGSSGHLWQGRYYSCPLDTPHFWAALRYTELNPVRAGMVVDPADYRWSSASIHCGTRRVGADLLELTPWRDAWTPADWRGYLLAAMPGTEVDAIRQSTHTGRPLGSGDFVANLERKLGRRLRGLGVGRPEGSGRSQEVALAASWWV